MLGLYVSWDRSGAERWPNCPAPNTKPISEDGNPLGKGPAPGLGMVLEWVAKLTKGVREEESNLGGGIEPFFQLKNRW